MTITSPDNSTVFVEYPGRVFYPADVVYRVSSAPHLYVVAWDNHGTVLGDDAVTPPTSAPRVVLRYATRSDDLLVRHALVSAVDPDVQRFLADLDLPEVAHFVQEVQDHA